VATNRDIHPTVDRDDSALVQAVQQGDLEAFEPLLDRHVQPLRTFIALKVPVPHLVDEIAHDALVFAFQHIQEFTPGTAFQSWLRSIAWNLLRAEVQRFSRAQANRSRHAEQEFWDLTGKLTEAQASQELLFLEECIEGIPPDLKKLLSLKYTSAFSTEEIASQMQRSLVWVRTVLFRVRAQLRQCIEQKTSASKPC
jgi:RNA polymerase sigma-70 factor, ECF subfamily